MRRVVKVVQPDRGGLARRASVASGTAACSSRKGSVTRRRISSAFFVLCFGVGNRRGREAWSWRVAVRSTAVTRMISLKGQPNSVRSRSLGRVGRSPLPGRLGFRFRRWRSRLFRPVSRTVRSRRGRRGYLRGIDKTHRWRSRNGLMRVLQLVSYVGGAVLLAWVVWAAVIVVTDNTHHGPIDVEQVCKDTNFSCGALAGTLGPVFSLALASALFFMVRPGMVCRPYVPRVSALGGGAVAGPRIQVDLIVAVVAWPDGGKSGFEELAAQPGEHVGG
jgi:hypothetical protein